MTEKYSMVKWPIEGLFYNWKIPEGQLESFLKILEVNRVDLQKVTVRFYGP